MFQTRTKAGKEFTRAWRAGAKALDALCAHLSPYEGRYVTGPGQRGELALSVIAPPNEEADREWWDCGLLEFIIAISIDDEEVGRLYVVPDDYRPSVELRWHGGTGQEGTVTDVVRAVKRLLGL